MLLAEVDIYEVLLAAMAVAAIVGLGVTVIDRRAKYIRQERDEAVHENLELRAKVAELEARPDMTRVAELLTRHEQRATERHDRTIRVLERIADAWDVRLKNGGKA